jgi:hypothetical protein
MTLEENRGDRNGAQNLQPSARNGARSQQDYYANLITEKGTAKIRLFVREAPETVNNFVSLALEGY